MSSVEPFKPQSLSIRKLFGDADSFYRIPRYQRPYKWSDEEVDKLWEDITDAWENDKPNYFLGSIITARPKDEKSAAYLDVVDGQQRLTTLMILFCVMRDLYPNLNASLMETDPFAINSDAIRSSIVINGKIPRLKLVTHSQHQSDFEALVLNGDTRMLEKPKKRDLSMDQEPKFKFMNAAALFKTHLQALGEAGVGELANFLFDHVHLIRIDCQDREFAIRLFQVLNDRGLDLTAADLIKSLLIERLHTKYAEAPAVLEEKENQFIADWRSMEQTANGVQLALDDLFTLYEYYRLAANPKRALYDEMTVLLADQDPNGVAAELKNFANNYATQVYHTMDRSIHCLWYLRWSVHWKSILLAAVQSGRTDLSSLASAICRFYYLYWIAGKTLPLVKQTSFNVIKALKDGKSLDEIEADLNARLVEHRILPAVLESIASRDIASEPWCKPLLLMMEYHSTDSTAQAHIELNRDLHLEHILPEKWYRFPQWGHIRQSDADEWLNSAGNVTLLSGSKNIEASNNPFHTKLDVYRGKGKYKDKDEGITAFNITQSIVNAQEKGAFDGDWNVEAMKARREWFMTQVGKLLQIDTTVPIGPPVMTTT